MMVHGQNTHNQKNKQMSIEVKNITKFYGKQKALANVSFTLNKGESF